MIKLTKKEKKELIELFDGGDGLGWGALIKTLKKKNEKKYLVDFIDMVVFNYYLTNINFEGKDIYTEEDFDTYYNLKQFVMGVYDLWKEENNNG